MSLGRLEAETQEKSIQTEGEESLGAATMSRECEHPTNPVKWGSAVERVPSSSASPFVCVHVGVRVRGLQALRDPEMSPGSQWRTPLAGQRSFYALICKQRRSIWQLLVLGLCEE